MSRLISYLRICFQKIFNVLADLTSGDNFPHNLGPRYRKECLPYVTVLKLGVEKSDCLKKVRRVMVIKNITNISRT